jgi:hypothetical protein
MNQTGIYQALNRLLTILYRSLPMYLTYACPWTHRGDDRALAALKRIVEDQKQMSQRLAEHIMAHYGPVEPDEYPSDYPDTHDLSLDYLIGKLVQCQKNDIAAIERCVTQLHGDREAASLAEESLGAARGHLETLEELAAEYVKPSSWAR